MLANTLKQLLGEYRPERLLVAGEAAREVGSEWVDHSGAELVDLTENPLGIMEQPRGVADLALITDILSHLSHDDARQLLGWLRNAGARRVAVSVAPGDDWSFNDMIALAFRRYSALDDGTTVYAYDIETYNRPRDWNNPRYWANPENWGKYRW
ncbi:DUF6231 family protein [Marinobacter nanhaiticus D15-8W]|uniref:Class I SAM-dependent methyltransferase n=1 Tax=Marinobacter nanhaiticus D15-8W TaxID=626887 RepID=N6X794_9GAMM|nr:DUF6231 family protein [Marinobacter nanhaiticus]ENO17013.1 hypothetical protein J057_01199 [Marinobacter nanhaiticus D15-8W]BES71991.1 DUF6231 family protein [Marinobacter nanhaiticus D15-8W]